MTSTLVLAIVGVAVIAVTLRRTLNRYRPTPVSASPVILPLLAAPTLLGLSVITMRGATVALAALVLLMVLTGAARSSPGSWRPAPVIALTAAYAMPLLGSPPIDRGLQGALLITLLVLAVRARPFGAVVSSLIDGVGLYLVVNVLAHLVGVQNPTASARTAGLESTSGGERVFYPFSTSLSIPPLMAAAFIAAFVICFEGNLQRRVFRAVALLCAVVVVSGANTRIALLVAVLISASTVIAPTLLCTFAAPVALLPLALPFIYTAIVDVLVRPVSAWVTNAIPMLSRGNEAGDVGFAGRDAIWATSLEFWRRHADAFHAFVGWGVHGQEASGASSVYGPRLVGLNSDPRLLSTHSSALQQLFDGGLIGVIALFVAVLLTVTELARRARVGNRAALVSLGVVTAIVLGAGTEVVLAPGFAQEPFWVFACMALAVARVPAGAPDQPPVRSAGHHAALQGTL